MLINFMFEFSKCIYNFGSNTISTNCLNGKLRVGYFTTPSIFICLHLVQTVFTSHTKLTVQYSIVCPLGAVLIRLSSTGTISIGSIFSIMTCKKLLVFESCTRHCSVPAVSFATGNSRHTMFSIHRLITDMMLYYEFSLS